MRTEIVIIIPYFRETPEWYEELAIKQAIRILNTYEHVLLVPQGLNAARAQRWYDEAGKAVIVKAFDAPYFSSPQSYNKLMLLPKFYEAFKHYQYMLIHQTDAWIFRDELDRWTNKGYDYIGAPWVNWIHAAYRKKDQSVWKKLLWWLGKRRFDAVGNGGLSLRNIHSIWQLLQEHQEAANNYPQNEDFFFSFEAKKLGAHLKIPTVKEALKFAFDEYPEKAYASNNNQLPMACHGWPKYFDFWKDKISLKGEFLKAGERFQ